MASGHRSADVGHNIATLVVSSTQWSLGFDFRHLHLTGHNEKWTLDIGCTHRSWTTHCSVDVGRGVPSLTVAFAHRSAIVRSVVPHLHWPTSNIQATWGVSYPHRHCSRPSADVVCGPPTLPLACKHWLADVEHDFLTSPLSCNNYKAMYNVTCPYLQFIAHKSNLTSDLGYTYFFVACTHRYANIGCGLAALFIACTQMSTDVRRGLQASSIACISLVYRC